MISIHHSSTEYFNWEQHVYDELDQLPADFDLFLSVQMEHIGAEPIWFNQQLSGMRFKSDRSYTLFLLRFS